MQNYGELRCELLGRVLHVQLSRPDKRNALTATMRGELVDCLGRAGVDEAISVVVMSGVDGTFCAGLDRAELLSDDSAQRARTAETSALWHRQVATFPKPLTAAVDGYALGTGFDLAVMCDTRIATGGAQFGHPEVLSGGVPIYTPLKDIVGAGWARELCLSGRRIDGLVAKSIGLVNDLVEPDDLMPRALEKAAAMAAVPLAALRATKALFVEAAHTEQWMAREHDDVFAAGLIIR
jgi:enoyl-CoA hydratase